MAGVLRHPVMTIGNFDGVHLGHRELFRRVVARAGEQGGESLVLTFDPHPLKFIAPERAPRLINTSAEKERLIAASQVDVLLTPPFTESLRALSAEAFVEQVLVATIGVRHVIVGFDYAFGAERQGDVELLRRLGDRHQFGVEVIQPVSSEGGVYSSTLIRRLVSAGRVAEVVSQLGRHFNLGGTVVAGVGRGRKLGFPTANLVTEKELLPADGVYAVKVRIAADVYDGVVNIGGTPTFADTRRTIEVHLLDTDRNLYGKQVRVYFIDRLREEKRFSGSDELVRAIAADVVRSREILSVARIVEYREYLSAVGLLPEGGPGGE